MASEEEELNRYANLARVVEFLADDACSYGSELLYIHSRLMIMDDRRIIVSFTQSMDIADFMFQK